MSKQYNVNLSFTADTSKTKQQLQDLQNQLQKLMGSSKLDLGIEKEVQGASKSIAELSTHLKQATNIQTGALDFSKFNQSIKESGMSLQKYGDTLMAMGPKGQQAFMGLTQAVMNSEVPIRRTNALLKEMGVTLANTVRWQLSSSMLHGFMGAVQSAYGYAQDLNESLNDIRIVTGQNIDQMAKFAQEANKAAKALSATTTDYTNASLIYYQQGLNDQQVKERTDITIKMANVAKQSAEVVSDQMTAVWNNFYDGSKSLEHYADVMTALGAATASSTDEIAGGLEKFAAIADTIGLSYEYAASALATITSNTRQAESVVGTALKTIFARIQGLKMGDTLEDGLDLNKYSKALQAVGISIFESNGELKRMDNILSEMGAKWDDLNKAQQVALAQTVAGVRQYNQLVSLMDNWDNGDADSFMANLNTANTSAGSLQEQADIYAESWEAAQDRVQAALEGVYSSLIKDDFFIDFLNSIEKIISFVDDLIDKMGGLKGVLAAIGVIVTKVFSDQLAKGLSNLGYNLKMATKRGRVSVANEKKAFISDAKERLANVEDDGSPTVHKAASEAYDAQLSRQQQLLDNAGKLNEVEKQTVQTLMDQLKAKGDLAIATAKEVDAARQQQSNAAEILYAKAAKKANESGVKFDIKAATEQINYLRQSAEASDRLKASLEGVRAAGKSSATSAQEMRNIFNQLRNNLPNLIDDEDVAQANELIGYLDTLESGSDEWLITLEQIQGVMGKISQKVKESAGAQLGATAEEVDKYTNSVEKSSRAQSTHKASGESMKKTNKEIEDTINSARGAQLKWSDLLVNSAQIAMNAAMAFSSLSGMIDTLKDPDASGWEKFSSVLMTFGMLIPALVNSWSALKTLISAETVEKIANVAATIAQVGAEKALNKEKGLSKSTTEKNIKETHEDTKRKRKDIWNQKSKADWDKADDATKTKYREKYLESQGYKRYGNEKGGAFKWSKTGPKGAASANNLAGADPSIDAGAKELFGKAGAKSVTTFGLSIAAIAAGIAVLAGGIAWGIKQANKAEEAIQKAQETVNGLKVQLDTVKSSYEDFNNQVSTFESASKGIEGLTKGTQEYRDAVFEANQAAMALIESNDNLKYTVKDGIITFEDGELNRALQNSQKAVVAASAAKTAGDQALLKAKEAKQIRDLARDTTSKSDDGMQAANLAGSTLTGVSGGALIGAGIGGIFGGGALSWLTAPVGAMIGAAVGGLGGLITGLVGNDSTGVAGDAETQAIQKIAEAYQQDSSILAKDKDKLIEYLSNSAEKGGLGIDKELAAALAEDTAALNDLAAELAANTEAVNAQNDAIAAQALGDKDFVAKSDYGDAIIDRAGDAYGNLVTEILNSDLKDYGKNGISKATGVNDDAEAVFQSYLKAAGLDKKGYQLKDTTGTDSNREFVYLDENQQEQTVSLETMQYTMASAQALQRLEQIAAQMAIDFNKWANKDDPASQAMLSFLTNGNFGNATEGEFDTIAEDVEKAGGAKEYLSAQLGDLEKAAEKYGYANADALVRAFELALANGASDWDDIANISGMTEKVRKNMNLNAAETFKKTINFMDANSAGEEAGQEFLGGLNKVIAQLDPKDQEKAWGKFAEIDWTQFNAGYEVIDILEELGYTISEDALPQFEQWVRETNKATLALYNFGEEMNNIAKANSVVEDIKIGDILSKEDYELLIDYNKELEKYFDILANGTARFVGDPLDLMQDMQAAEQKKYKDAIGYAEDSYDNILKRKANQDKADTYGGYDALSVQAGTTTTQQVTTQNETNFLTDVGGGVLTFLGYMGSAMSGQPASGNFVEDTANMSQFLAGSKTEETQVFDRNAELYEAQINFLNDVGADLKGINQDSSTYTEDDAQKILDLISEYADQAVSKKEMEEAAGAVNQAQLEYARSAETAQDREKMADSGEISTDVAAKAGLEAHKADVWQDIDPKEVEEYADSLMEAAEASDLLSDELKDNEEAAEDVALYTKKMNQGIEKLSEGIEDWASVLEESDEGSEEYSDAMRDMKDAMSDVLGVSEDFLSDSFIVDNLEDIKLAAEGDADAIDRLAIAAGKDILIYLDLKDEGVREEILALHDQLAAEIPNIEVGATLDSGDFLTKAAQVVETAQMSVEEANAYFRSMGFEPHFETKTIDVTRTPQGTRTYRNVTQWNDAIDTNGKVIGKYPGVIEEHTESFDLAPVTEKMEVPALTTDGGKPNFTLTRTNAGAMNNSSSSNPGGKSSGGGGGGGSKPKKTSDARKSKDDYVERYKEINDQLDDTRDKMEDANRAASALWGPARLKEMQKVSQQMEKEIKLTKQKTKEAKEYLKADKKNLNKTLSDASSEGVNLGVSFGMLGFDSNDNITNIEDIQNKIFEKRESLLNSFGSEMDEGEQEQLDAFDKWADKFKEALEQYDDTKELIEDLENEAEEQLLAWQENNFEMLNIQLEVELTVDETQLKEIEYYLSKSKDDIWGMVEAATLMTGIKGDGTLSQDNSQFSVWTGQLDTYQEQYDDLVYQYTHIDPETGATYINQAQFIEGLQKLQDGLYDTLTNLNQLDEQMIHYYGDTLAAAQAELSQYTDLMDHHNNVFNHYKNLLDLLGKSKDYERMGVILEGQVKVAENAAAVSKANYEMLAQEAADKQAAWEAIKDSKASDYDKELAKQQWLDAQNAANEAQNQMLEDAAAWAESLKAVLENELAELSDILEKSLAGDWGSLDNLMTSMDRAKSLQEEYLTTTNQVYETNKLMNKAQQEIDKTTNTAAKRRMSQFIEETEMLQNKNKLSKFELEIQQAKYDLLMAEIALEEAQNAKSTVRLQRDSEGNFGYVYTADQNAVAEAEQKVADAQNNLYNIGLEGANRYAESYAQTVQEMNDAVTELTQAWVNGEITSKEEYQERMLELEEYYGEKLMQYSELHTIALGADTRIKEEAWSKSFAGMTTKTQQWMTNVDTYVGGVITSFGKYETGINTIESNVGLDLESLKTKTGNITTENDKLAQSITKKPGGLLDAMQKQITKISKLTNKYKDLRKEILKNIEDAERLASIMGKTIETESDDDESNDLTPTTDGEKCPKCGKKGCKGNCTPPDDSVGGGQNNGKIEAGDKVTCPGTIYESSDSTSGESTSYKGQTLYIQSINGKVEHNGRVHLGTSAVYAKGKNDVGWVDVDKIKGYDTGGYTGEWGPGGKFAVLHEKEIVLNKEDTANLLSSMDLLNNIISTIDLYSANAQFANLLSSPAYNAPKEAESLEQNVHIEASFPGVSDHSEIEEALNNLVNKASQFIHRNK